MKSSHVKIIRFCTPLIALVLWLWSKTLRVHYSRDAQALVENKNSRAVIAVWHGCLFGLMPVMRFRKTCCLLSASDDGRLLGGLIKWFGYDAVYGSSSRGGMRALLQMVRKKDAYHEFVFAVDGPRGPREKVKPGVVALASFLKLPIIPLSCSYVSAWTLSSWDQHRIPKPFSRVFVRCGDPIQVGAISGNKDDSSVLNEYILRVEVALKQISV